MAIHFVPDDDSERQLPVAPAQTAKPTIHFLPDEGSLSRTDLAAFGVTDKTSLKQRRDAANMIRRMAEQSVSDVDAVTRAAPQAQNGWQPNANDLRPNGTQKGTGWLGVKTITGPNGETGVATEYTTQSDAVRVNDKRIDFPSLVPGLSEEQQSRMLTDIIPNHKPVPEDVMQIAIDHAKKQLNQGKSVFAPQAPATPYSPQTTFSMTEGTPPPRPNVGVRFGKQLWNRGIAAILHTMGKSDMSPAEMNAFEAQNNRIEQRKKAGHRAYTPALLEDEFEDIKRQLVMPPQTRADKDLRALSVQKPTEDPFAFRMTPPQNTAEKIADVSAGLAAFISQIAIAKKILPVATSEAALWETVTQASGGRPGEGAAMAATLGTIGNIPAVSTAGKVAKMAATSGAFAGVTALSGGNTEDIIISSLVPVVLQGVDAGRGRWSDAKTVRQWRKDIPWMKDVSYETSLKMASAMRESARVNLRTDPKVRQAEINQANTKYKGAIDDFLKEATQAVPGGRKPVSQEPAPERPTATTSLGFPTQYQSIAEQTPGAAAVPTSLAVPPGQAAPTIEKAATVPEIVALGAVGLRSRSGRPVAPPQAVSPIGGEIAAEQPPAPEGKPVEAPGLPVAREGAGGLQPDTGAEIAQKTPAAPSLQPTARQVKPQPEAATKMQAEIGRQYGLTEDQVVKRLQKAEQRYIDLKNKPQEDLTPGQTKELDFLTRKRTDVQALLGRDIKPLSREQVEKRAEQYGIPFRGRTTKAVLDDIQARLEEQQTRKLAGDLFEWKKGEAINVTPDKLLRYSLQHEAKGAKVGYRAGQIDLAASHEELLAYAKEYLPAGEYNLVAKAAEKVVRSRTPGEMDKIVRAVNKMVENYEKASVKKELKKTAKDVLARIKANKSMQEKGIRAEYGERLTAMLEEIALSDPRKKTLADIASLTDYVTSLREDIANEYNEPYAEELIPKARLALLDRIGQKSLKHMNVDEMRDIIDEIKRILHMNATKNKTILHLRTAENAELLTNCRKEVANAISRAEKEEILESAGQKEGIVKGIVSHLAGYMNDDVETLIESVSGGEQGELYEVCCDEVREGREMEARAEYAMIDPLAETHKKLGVDLDWLKENVKEVGGRKAKRHTVTIGGKAVKLTTDEIMDVAMAAKSADDRREILKSGLAFPRRKIGTPTGAELKAIVDLADKTARAITDSASKNIKTIQQPALNKVSRELDAIDRFTEEDYWPRVRLRKKGIRGKKGEVISQFENRTWTNQRVGGTEPFVIVGFYTRYYGMARSTAEYIGMAKPFRAVKMLLNDKQIMDTIDEKGYDKQRENLNTLFERMEGHPTDDSYISRFFSFFLRGTTRAVLAEPGIMLGQYTSVGGYFTEADAKHLTALRGFADDETLDWVKKNYAWARKRFDKKYSSASLGDIAAEKEVYHELTGKERLVDKPTSGIHTVDTWAILEAVRIARAEIAADTLTKNLEGDARDTAIRRRADYLVRRTQPMFDTEGRSVLTSDPRAAVKQFVLFRSYIDQTLRMAHRANTKYANRKIGKAEWAKQVGTVWSTLAFNVGVRALTRLLLYHGAAVALSLAIYGKAKLKDPKEIAFDFTRDVALAPLKCLTYVGYLAYWAAKSGADVIGKRVGAKKKVYAGETDMGTIAQSLIVDIVNAVSKYSQAAGYTASGETFQSGPRKGQSKALGYLWDGTKEMVGSVATAFGAPVGVVEKFYREWEEQLDAVNPPQTSSSRTKPHKPKR